MEMEGRKLYIKRNLERKFLKLNGFFKVMLVTGARQVGKTTMLKHLAEGTNRTYVSMDDLLARDLATRDPALFFQRYKPPILIDEIQKAPALLPEIKRICDETEEKGLFWLTGSQQFQMMTRVQETLAGRIGLWTFTAGEAGNFLYGRNGFLDGFAPFTSGGGWGAHHRAGLSAHLGRRDARRAGRG